MININFWEDGFSIDDGPLRKLEDPANASFLKSINDGECPRELAPANPTQPVRVNLVRKSTVYVAPPKPKYTAFRSVLFGGG